MSLLEVCALLRKSTAQVYRYVKDGLLHPVRNGRELVFDREEVLKFAESRGMRVAVESRVASSTNFFDQWAETMRIAPPGSTMTYKAPELAINAS